MERVTELQRTVPLLRCLSKTALRDLLATAQEERYGRGQVIFRQSEPAHAYWIVLKGWVHLIRTAEHAPHADGAVLFTITPEEALCGISAIASGAYTLSGVAATTCRLLRIPAAAFNRALRSEPALAYGVLELVTRRIGRMAQQYGTMAEPVTYRLVRSILRLRDQFGDTLPVTHRELGQMAWTTTESAIRAVRGLKRKGYLAGSRGRVLIRQPDALAGMVAGRNGHPGPSRTLPAPNERRDPR